MERFRERNGFTATVLSKVATAEPMSAELGVSDLTDFPANAWTITGHYGGLRTALHIDRVSNIDQKRQQFSMKYTVTFTWKDCRLLSSCDYMHVNDNSKYFSNFWAPRWLIEEQEDKTEFVGFRRHTIF